MSQRLFIIVRMVTVLVMSLAALRADAAGKEKTSPPQTAKASGFTVAVLDFESTSPGNPQLGKQIAETLAATLSGEDGFTLVDRTSLEQVLREHELNQTGLVNPEQANKIGTLVGANILITGKIFPVGEKQLFFTVKIIGVATSLLDGIVMKTDQGADLGAAMMKLSAQVARNLHEKAPKLLARDDRLDDPLPGLIKSLTGRKMPKMLVEIRERHISAAIQPSFDPAAETEFQSILKQAGFKVFAGDEKAAAEAGVDLVIDGSAFSEFAARIATLESCVARVEIKISDRKTGEVLYSDRETARAVDLAENIAGKTAIQKASRLLAIRVLRYFDATLAKKK